MKKLGNLGAFVDDMSESSKVLDYQPHELVFAEFNLYLLLCRFKINEIKQSFGINFDFKLAYEGNMTFEERRSVMRTFAISRVRMCLLVLMFPA